MSINSSLSGDGRTVTIAVAGRFDFSTHQEFLKAYKAYEKGDKEFVVDLARADYMDSSAMGMLLQLREHAAKDRVVELRNGSEAIKDILRIANFDKLFKIE
jgi:anti-anti-sigma factor